MHLRCRQRSQIFQLLDNAHVAQALGRLLFDRHTVKGYRLESILAAVVNPRAPGGVAA